MASVARSLLGLKSRKNFMILSMATEAFFLYHYQSHLPKKGSKFLSEYFYQLLPKQFFLSKAAGCIQTVDFHR